MRLPGMMLPGNASRVTTPLTRRAVLGSKICTPIASSSEKSPRRMARDGTELVTVSIVLSCSFSYDPMKNVRFLKIGPDTIPLKRL